MHRKLLQLGSWIWAAGCIAWAVDGLLCLRYPDKSHAVLGFLMALLFGIAWLFYRQQK